MNFSDQPKANFSRTPTNDAGSPGDGMDLKSILHLNQIVGT